MRDPSSPRFPPPPPPPLTVQDLPPPLSILNQRTGPYSPRSQADATSQDAALAHHTKLNREIRRRLRAERQRILSAATVHEDVVAKGEKRPSLHATPRGDRLLDALQAASVRRAGGGAAP